MKNSLVTYLLGFFFLITCCKSIAAVRPGIDTNSCLEIDGLIQNATIDNKNNCTVELLRANTVIETIVLDGKKKFRFYLNKNTMYSIRISKKGFITRLVAIDTRMLRTSYDLYSFSFETSLPEEASSEKMNKNYIDFPIALVYFDNRKDCFVYDKSYTAKLKKEIAMN